MCPILAKTRRQKPMTNPLQDQPISRRQAMTLLFGGSAAIATGCKSFGLLGYSTTPNYDPSISTVYVPMFKCRMLETSPFRGIEFTMTRAVVDAINSKTPMKVLSDPNGADTELQGTVIGVTKLLTNRTPFNEVREVAIYLYVEVVWHDLRPGNEGKVLTNPRQRNGSNPPINVPFDPTIPITAPGPEKPQAVQLTSIGRAIPELGESITTGLQMAINRMAVNIVSAMEQPW